MLIIGLTGGWGTGKSTAAKMFAYLGAEVIDADKIAHDVIRPRTAAYEKLIGCFGRSILKSKSAYIDREKLAKIAFSGKDFLQRLNKIVHPRVISRIKAKISHTKAKIVVIDAALLIETGLNKICDALIVVATDKKTQLERLRQKTGLNPNEIKQRLPFQLSVSKKIKMADFVIDNNKTIASTRRQVKDVWAKLTSRRRK